MSFVSLGGDGLRPTFFELVAADRLMASLKAAVVYSLSVYAQRRPSLHRLLDREDELFFLLSVLLDRQSLAASNGSFAEGLYGLRRAAVASAGSPGGPPGSAAAGAAAEASSTCGSATVGSRPLSPSQRHMSLVLLTLVPFLRSKLDALHQQLQIQQQQQPARQGQHAVAPGEQRAGGLAAAQRSLRAAALRAFLLLYPWAAAAHEGARFAYQLLYLLGRTPFYSPGLHLLGLQVVRLTGQEAVQQERTRQQRRADRLARLAGPSGGNWLWRLLRRGWVQAGYAVADHTRSALILSVFAFKLLEWWYGSAEQKLGEQKALPPPPPPPPLPLVPPAAGGLALPADPALCPLCRRRRTNPALVATSGHVFCYPCIHREVSERGRCPVTHAPARLDHVWRLYQGGA